MENFAGMKTIYRQGLITAGEALKRARANLRHMRKGTRAYAEMRAFIKELKAQYKAEDNETKGDW